MKEEALDRTLRRTGLGGGCGPVVRQTTQRMNGKYLIIVMGVWCNFGQGVRLTALTVRKVKEINDLTL